MAPRALPTPRPARGRSYTHEIRVWVRRHQIKVALLVEHRLERILARIARHITRTYDRLVDLEQDATR